MNEELTREVLEEMKKCNLFCHSCGANWVCNKYDWQDTVQALATALLEERAKPKDDVWKNAPYWAKGACVIWDDGEGQKYTRLYNSERYTRELPKTRARIIAEQEGQGLAKKKWLERGGRSTRCKCGGGRTQQIRGRTDKHKGD